MTLDEAFTHAKDHALELDAARQRINTAEINVARAWALLKPTWGASFTYTHSEPQPAERPPLRYPVFEDGIDTVCTVARDAQGNVLDFSELVPCLNALSRGFENIEEQPFDVSRADTTVLNTQIQWTPLNGRAIPTIANAEDAVDLERHRYAAAVQSHQLAVARAYYAAVATKDAIAAAERAETRAAERLKESQGRAELGRESTSRVTAAEIAVAQAKLDVARAENTHAQGLIALAYVVGMDRPHDVVRPALPKAPDGTDAALAEQGIAARKDIMANRLALVMAHRTKDEAWWKFAPTVGMFTALRHSNLGGLDNRNYTWTVGVTANLLLYDAGLRYQDLASADASIRAAKLALQRGEAALRRDVQRARLRIDAAQISEARADQTMRLANQRVELTRAQLDAGVGRATDLNEALDRVADAERLRIRASLDRALAILELRHATGRLGD